MYDHRYTVYSQELDHVETEQDLAITVDSSLKFEQHILGKIKQAN